MTTNSFGTRDRLTVGGTTYGVHRLDRIDGAGRLPYSLKVLLENLARNEDGLLVTADHKYYRKAHHHGAIMALADF